MGTCCGKPDRDNEVAQVNLGASPEERSSPANRGALRTPRPEKIEESWSKAALLKQREAFWDTRVEGNTEVWATLKMVAEMMEVDTGNGENISTAKMILESTGITTPNGLLIMCYDERGHDYHIPNWVLVEPPNLTADTVGSNGETAPPKDSSYMQSLEDAGGDPGTPLSLKVRIGAEDITVELGEKESVYILKQKTLAGKEDVHVNNLRLFFYGQELKEWKALKDCRGLQTDMILIGSIGTETPQ